MLKEDVIWLAGFFDGDGSYLQTKNGDVTIAITQKDPTILRLIHSMTRLGKIRSFTGYEGNIYWRLDFQAEDAYRFIALVGPYMRTNKIKELTALYSDKR